MTLSKSRIFLYFCLAFILGVSIASFIEIPLVASGVFLMLAISVIMVFWQRKWELVVFGFCLIFILAGIWRFQARTKISPDDISRFNGQGRIIFRGIVDAEPEIKTKKQKIIIQTKEVEFLLNHKKEKVSGRALVLFDKFPEYHYGDEVKITGQLKQPENFIDETGKAFDYRAYLAKDDIYAVSYSPEVEILASGKGNKIKEVLFSLKNSFKSNLAQTLPEPQNSLAKGLILGEKTGLPRDLLDIFAVVGITHIIALSGYNITIISETLRRAFDKLMISRDYSFWLSVGLIIVFVIMTGASASVVRAAIMGILLILARKSSRLYSIRNALIFTGVLMIYSNPKILRFDTGFQLSFLATLGLVYISPLLEKYVLWLPKFLDLQGIASATLGAQIAVLPLILFNFGKLSLIAPLTNVLILPIIPLAMFFAFLSGLFSWFALVFGKTAGWFAWLALSYQIKIAELSAKVPFAALEVKISWIWLVLAYVLLWLVIIRLQHSLKETF